MEGISLLSGFRQLRVYEDARAEGLESVSASIDALLLVVAASDHASSIKWSSFGPASIEALLLASIKWSSFGPRSICKADSCGHRHILWTSDPNRSSIHIGGRHVTNHLALIRGRAGLTESRKIH